MRYRLLRVASTLPRLPLIWTSQLPRVIGMGGLKVVVKVESVIRTRVGRFKDT